MTCVCVFLLIGCFPLSFSESRCWWVRLLRVVTHSLHQLPLLSPPSRVETVADCFSILLPRLNPSQLHSVSTVPVEQWGRCTGNLCIISALLTLCLCGPLKSTAQWNKTPCFLSLPLLLSLPPVQPNTVKNPSLMLLRRLRFSPFKKK